MDWTLNIKSINDLNFINFFWMKPFNRKLEIKSLRNNQ